MEGVRKLLLLTVVNLLEDGANDLLVDSLDFYQNGTATTSLAFVLDCCSAGFREVRSGHIWLLRFDVFFVIELLL